MSDPTFSKAVEPEAASSETPRSALAPVAVLLDRDGTINVDTGYISDPDTLVLEDGAVQGLQALTVAGIPLVVLSNQSGIGRGFFGMAAVDDVNRALERLLARDNVAIAAWYVCPHHPDAHDCDCRKPLPGLALRAASDLRLDLSACWMIGDKRSDLEMADAVGASSILVLTGEGAEHQDWAIAHGKPVCATLADAAVLILAATDRVSALQAARAGS